MIARVLLGGWVLFAVSACAAGAQVKPAGKADEAPGTMLICTMERPTGSMIFERVCRTRVAIDAERRSAEDLLSKPGVQIEKGN